MWPRTSHCTSLSLSFLIFQMIITFALQWCHKNPQKVNRKSGRERCRVSSGCLLGSGLTGSGAHPHSGSPLPRLPSGPGLARWQEQGNAASCMLLVYFEKPPVSSPAWGHVVAAGLCSQDGFRAGPCPPFATHSHPFSSLWPGTCEPHFLTPS